MKISGFVRCAPLLLIATAGCEDENANRADAATPDGAANGTDAPAPDATDAAPGDGPNAAPAVTTGPAQRSLVDRRVTLAATASDPEGQAVSYLWTQTGGPPITLGDKTTASLSFRVQAAGVYEFSVTASDGLAVSAPATTSVAVYDLNGGEDHSIALEPDGTLWAWGGNYSGQLGIGTTDDAHLRARVCDAGATNCAADPLTGVIAISAGRAHTLALKADGTVWAWGSNGSGELGDGTNDQRSTPVAVCRDATVTDCRESPLSGVVAIAAGYQHSVALKADGSVWAWGYGGDGQLGAGTTDSASFPQPVCAVGATAPCTAAAANTLRGIAQIAAGGGGHTLALTGSGALFAWGHNKNGQVGNGNWSTQAVTIPVPVCAPGQLAPCAGTFTGITDIDAWSGHSLALDAQGTFWGWGGNNDGELSMVTSETCVSAVACAQSPRRVCASHDEPCTTPLAGVVAFAAGRRFSVALLGDGSLRGWGDNTFGQLGDGTTELRTAPVRTCAPGQTAPCGGFLDRVVAPATGSFHTLALTSTGLYAWGDNDHGQLGVAAGDVAPRAVPIAVAGF